MLVAGGAGFIGTNFIRHCLATSNFRVVNLDALTYAGGADAAQRYGGEGRYRFVKGRIGDSRLVGSLLAEEKPSLIVNLAAETHVDRSIADAAPFVQSNIVGCDVLLRSALRYWERMDSDTQGAFRFLQVSTDEVYGDVPEAVSSSEESVFLPNSPYSASKAAAEHFVRAYRVTYGLPTLTVRACNNFGPFQFPEKLIPTMISRALRDEALPVYGDGGQIREWIYVDDMCSALMMVLRSGESGDVFNIGTGFQKTNLEVVEVLLAKLEVVTGRKSASVVAHVEDRLGHDRRYSIDSTKIMNKFGFSPELSFEEGMQSTISWYVANRDWLRSRAGIAV